MNYKELIKFILENATIPELIIFCKLEKSDFKNFMEHHLIQIIENDTITDEYINNMVEYLKNKQKNINE